MSRASVAIACGCWVLVAAVLAQPEVLAAGHRILVEIGDHVDPVVEVRVALEPYVPARSRVNTDREVERVPRASQTVFLDPADHCPADRLAAVGDFPPGSSVGRVVAAGSLRTLTVGSSEALDVAADITADMTPSRQLVEHVFGVVPLGNDLRKPR